MVGRGLGFFIDVFYYFFFCELGVMVQIFFIWEALEIIDYWE